MQHVAIMKKSWELIPKIISGQKNIESRWYQTRRVPWNSVSKGDTVFFKNSGEPIIARAEVSKVIQFEISNKSDVEKIVSKYGEEICLINKDVSTWGALPRYCILIFLINPIPIKSFNINKKGFGNATAWITIPNINKIIYEK